MKDLKPLNRDSGKLFEAYGMTEEEFWNMPYKELWKLMNGRPTGVTSCGRLSIVRMEDGEQIGVITRPQERPTPTPLFASTASQRAERPIQTRLPIAFPLRRKGNLEVNLSEREMAMLMEQGVIYKELNNDGVRNRSFVQLDRETNHLMVAKADDVGQYFPTSIFKVTLTKEERDQLREGKTVVVSDGEQKYVIKVDLNRRAGFSVKRL